MVEDISPGSSEGTLPPDFWESLLITRGTHNWFVLWVCIKTNNRALKNTNVAGILNVNINHTYSQEGYGH